MSIRSRHAPLAAVALLTMVAGCSDDPDAVHGSTTLGDPAGAVAADAEGRVELAEDDVAGLLWMREEEQLAHDVYAVLGDEWGVRVFDNIAAAEQRHVEQVVGLLDRYGVDDPMADRPAGTFTIPEMQAAFDEFVADGSASLVDALEVGALIEELDIVDLRARASDVVEIQAVYERLEKGSRRHLRAFVDRLEARDVAYAPTQLDAAAFVEIVGDA